MCRVGKRLSKPKVGSEFLFVLLRQGVMRALMAVELCGDNDRALRLNEELSYFQIVLSGRGMGEFPLGPKDGPTQTNYWKQKQGKFSLLVHALNLFTSAR